MPFNSTMVQLTYGSRVKLKIVGIFQFHCGTINIPPPFFTPNSILPFQFHYGTINIIQTRGRLSLLYPFNSTMARLIFPRRYKFSKSNRSNSPMVRFTTHDRYWTVALVFNSTVFRYGAINVIAQLVPRLSSFFQSTVVRLPFCFPSFISNSACFFQFHYGTIN